MSDSLMGSLRSRNISQIITERIASSILSGELQPGQKLPTEEEFAARIGAGKSSVREAIKILEALGVVEIRRADGTYVVDEFRGSMLDATIYGILLSEHQAEDIVSFKVGVQRLAADCLSRQEKRDCTYDQLSLIESASKRDAVALNAACMETETRLADEVDNPLVAELYRQAIRIAAHQQEQLAQMLVSSGRGSLVGEWAAAYVQAIAASDCDQVHHLLQRELEALREAVA